MAMPRPLPDDLVDQVARRFRVIGEPARIRLLDRLRDGDATVGELTAVSGSTQQNVSKHLAVLHDAGIVHRTKLGTSVRYGIADPTVFALCEIVCGDVQEAAA
jgi:DNA-binding transcriptional ArsR family regulator